MTYEGLFEKCNTLAELHTMRNQMRAKYNDPLSIMDQDRAFKKRRKEIVRKYKENPANKTSKEVEAIVRKYKEEQNG